MGDWLELKSQSNLQYVFLPETSGAVRLKVKAANDAHIALTDGPFESNLMTEIRIGGWSNTKSTIRRNQRKPDKVKVLTPGILNANEFIFFWIRWHDNEVSVGLKGKPAFIKYLDPEPHPINYFAVRTGWGAVGHWKIEVSPVLFHSLPVKPIKGGQLRWVTKTPEDHLPQDALIAGYEMGEVLYIGRAMQRGSLIPGKYVPSKKNVVVGYQRILTEYATCEILCGYNASWVETTEGIIPPHAFEAGYDHGASEPYFIGRTCLEGNLIPGKVNCSHKLCYLPYKATEVDVRAYEILVIPDKLPNDVIWRPKSKHNRVTSHIHNRRLRISAPRRVEQL